MFAGIAAAVAAVTDLFEACTLPPALHHTCLQVAMLSVEDGAPTSTIGPLGKGQGGNGHTEHLQNGRGQVCFNCFLRMSAKLRRRTDFAGDTPPYYLNRY